MRESEGIEAVRHLLASPSSPAMSVKGAPENFFAGLDKLPSGEEKMEDVVRTRGTRIERIVSHGQASPPDFWYDQDHAEWVVLLQGSAELQFADRTVQLEAGQHVFIGAHERHRVARTAEATVWLAVHIGDSSEAAAGSAPNEEEEEEEKQD